MIFEFELTAEETDCETIIVELSPPPARYLVIEETMSAKPWDSLRTTAPIKPGEMLLGGHAMLRIHHFDGSGVRLQFGVLPDRDSDYSQTLTKSGLRDLAELCGELEKQLS